MTSSSKFHGGLSTTAPLPSCLSYEFDNHHPYTMYHVPAAIVTDLMQNSMKEMVLLTKSMMQTLYLFPLHRPASYNKYKGTEDLLLPHLYRNTEFIFET